MTFRRKQPRRRGSVVPVVVLGMVGMCGFVALAVDVGLMAVVKTQCQNSADAAAMAGARSLDGTPGQNLGNPSAPGTVPNSATDNALATAQANLVLSSTVPQSGIAITFGAWHYDPASQLFVPNFPPVAPDNYNLCQVTVTYNLQTTFAPVFSLLDPTFNSVVTISATSQGAHRPRDVGIILDYSGSMNNESDLWNDEGYLDNGNTNTTSGYVWPKTDNPNFTSNNVETVYPLFGHYANEKDYTNYVNYANLLSPYADATSPLYNNSLIGKSNVSQPVSGVAAIVNDFYQNNFGAAVVQAFTSAPDDFAYGNDTTHSHLGFTGAPAQGDNYLPKFGKSIVSGDNPTPPGNLVTNVNDLFSSPKTYDNTFETQGYKGYNGGVSFKGYTVGPRYWGKTFFVWPPDPTNDWRTKFFFKSDGITPLNDNTQLFQNGYPGYKDPPGNYVINYKAILNWIKTAGPNPFPPQLRSGHVLFYDSIPTDVPATAYDHTQPNSNITDPNQRFWKEYIDWTLGLWRDPTGTVQHTQRSTCSIGPDYVFGTVSINAPPTSGTPVPYMNYNDNPWRPRHRMWFGPMTMIQYMSDTGNFPGTTHDISMYPMKNGVGGALKDIQNNHPNDLVSMILFSRPVFNNDPPGCGAFSQAQYNLTNDYASMINSLWLPPNSGSSDVRPWDANGQQTPRAHGDYDANTASVHGFMLAYNQFSGSTTLQAPPGGGPAVGGFGRRGASRLVIYETDGMANEDSIPQSGFYNGGAYNSYYHILPGDVLNGAGYDATHLLQVVETICNKDDGTPYQAPPTGYPTPPALPGYATVNKPVIIHCIAFGAIFENSNSIQTSSVSLLQQISTIGGTVFPNSASDPTNGFKWCIGTLSQRQAKLQQAFLTILDSSVPVSLIQ
jgi:hypothetical protein